MHRSALPGWDQGTQNGQELTRQGHRHTPSRCAHPLGNEGQQGPQDAEVIDEEEEVAGWLGGNAFQFLRIGILDS